MFFVTMVAFGALGYSKSTRPGHVASGAQINEHDFNQPEASKKLMKILCMHTNILYLGWLET